MIHLFKRVYVDYIDNFYNYKQDKVAVISSRWNQGTLTNKNVIFFGNTDLDSWLSQMGFSRNEFYNILASSNEKLVVYLDEKDLVTFAASHYRACMKALTVEGVKWILGNFQDEQRTREYAKYKPNPLCDPAPLGNLGDILDTVETPAFELDEPVPLVEYSIEWLLLRLFLNGDSDLEVKDAVYRKTMEFCDEVMVNTIKRIKERIFREGTEMGRILEGKPWEAGTMFDNLGRYPEYQELLNCKGLKTSEEIFNAISLRSIEKCAWDGHNECFNIMSTNTRALMGETEYLIENYEKSVADLKMELDYRLIPRAVKEKDLDTLLKLNIFAGQPMTYARGANKEEVSFAIINSILRAKRMEEMDFFKQFLLG